MSEPVTLAEARAQVNIIDSGDTTYDTFLTSLIGQARATVEIVSCFFWVAASRSEIFASWGEMRRRHLSSHHDRSQFLEIYRQPIASVNHIYYGPTGTNADTELTDFIAPVGQFPLRVYPAVDNSFPALDRGSVVTVEYTSAALDAASQEYLIGKRAMLLLIGHWFANREAVIADVRAAVADVPWAVTDLLDTLRPVSAY